MQVIAGREDDDTTGYRQQTIEHGDIIATGTVHSDGYGTTPTERAQFIVTTIRDHLTRVACSHHLDQRDTINSVLGTEARWCPLCGSRLPT